MCVRWWRPAVPKLGVQDRRILRAPPGLPPSLPLCCFCCRSSNPSGESLAPSVNPLLSCFTVLLIRPQLRGLRLSEFKRSFGAPSSLKPGCWFNINHVRWGGSCLLQAANSDEVWKLIQRWLEMFLLLTLPTWSQTER